MSVILLQSGNRIDCLAESAGYQDDNNTQQHGQGHAIQCPLLFGRQSNR